MYGEVLWYSGVTSVYFYFFFLLIFPKLYSQFPFYIKFSYMFNTSHGADVLVTFPLAAILMIKLILILKWR